MSEQEYEISFPPPLFFSDNDEISFDEFEQGNFLENYNKIFNNNDIYLKDFEVENEEEQDKIIDYVENIEFTPCIVIDFIKGKI